MRLPLTHWTLRGDGLPERLLEDERSGFTLPGAQALGAFAGLLGGAPDEQDAPEEEQAKQEKKEKKEASAPFALPAMIPDDVPGPVALTREIDFGSLGGDRALLLLDHIAGRGEVLLDGQTLARFDGGRASAAAAEMTGTPCMLAADLTDALCLGRRRTLTLRFDASRPAGVCGPVFLVTTERAHLFQACIAPDARRRTISLRAKVCARCAGRYVLRALPVSPGPSSAREPSAAREIAFDLAAGETREAALSMALEADEFVPGQAYAAAAVKLQLFFRPQPRREALCDEALLLCGYPARRACAHVPLTLRDCAGDPQALAARLTALHIPAVSLPAVLPDAVYRALCRAGIAVRQFAPEHGAALARYPNVLLSDAPTEGEALSPEVVAWQLCGMTALARTIDGTLTPGELLFEAAGRALDPDDAGVRGVLAWLLAVSTRMRAEAARQSRFAGSLCAPGALAHEEIRDALRTAFAPVHLSALPLCGAWWTGTRFSATVAAFLPPQETRTLAADVLLEDESGAVLAQLHASCTRSGEIGVLRAVLPEHPCVLTLTCRLAAGEDVLETHALPVYVGERGPLEAAFG